MVKPVIIVSGFLGCGKTSFLRRLLPLCKETGQRPALIINEVGDVDVDGECLADLHAEQVRLVGGCVCCTLQSQLSQTVYDVLDREACDLIIIECSGLSNPLDVVNALAAPALISRIAVSHIVCLLDAARCQKVLGAIEIAKAQVASSDIIILNKADTIDDSLRGPIEELVDTPSNHSTRQWTTYGDIGRENLLAILTDSAPTRCACGCGHDHHHHSHSLPASFCTVAMPLPETIGRDALQSLLESLPENVIRAKGFANIQSEGWHVIQKVYDAVNVIPHGTIAPSVGAVLICIGQSLAAEEILALVSPV